MLKMPDDLKEPVFSELALDILKDRYLHRDSEGNITETPKEMLWRVASAIAEVEPYSETVQYIIAKHFYEIMRSLDFLPNSPTLMNAGREVPHNQLAACFVIDVPDSMEGICEALRKQMLIHKTGGGTGFNFSKLRPEGSNVNSTNGRASGPVSFMRLFDLSTDIVQQGGMRRGANMAILDIAHPDIDKFISCKDEEGKITNFNLSVGVTDDFMKKAILSHSKERKLLMKIAEHAWKSGDPGIVFLDRLNENNPCPELGKIEATNPCGEAPLLAGEACNLGSINLAHMVKKNSKGELEIDFKRLRTTIEYAVRMLDDIIDAGCYPLPEIDIAVKKTRKIGLGVMGWADLLYQLHIPYASDTAVALAGSLMDIITTTAVRVSKMLGTEKGIPEACHKWLRRNATVTCIAPTGTLALLANASSGIEPVFSNSYKRRITLGTGEVIMKDINEPYYEKLAMEVSYSKLKEIAKTAYQIPWEYHVMHQAAFQLFTHLAVSKTVNLPADATATDVFNVYVSAWRSDCKGTTVYRNGSRGSQVLTENPELPPIKCTTC